MFDYFYLIEGNIDNPTLNWYSINDLNEEPAGFDGFPTKNTVFRIRVPNSHNNNIFSKLSQATIQPTLAKEYIQVDFEGNEEAVFNIINNKGQVVKYGIVAPQNAVYLNDLMPGNYVFMIKQKNKLPIPLKFVKI
jgi:hypothetical protein